MASRPVERQELVRPVGENEIHIFGAFDASYAMPAAAFLVSLRDAHHRDDRYILHLVPFRLPAAMRRQLEEVAGESTEIIWTDFDPSLLDQLPANALPKGSYLNETVYVRLFIDRLLPPEVDRVLLLDVDLVVTASLAELWRTSLDGHVLAGVRDVGSPTLSSPMAVSKWASIGLDGRAPYFNAGVLLVDRVAWRAADVERRTLTYLRDHGPTTFYDQEAMNAVLAGDWLEIPARWNAQMGELEQALASDEDRIFSLVSRTELTDALADPAIIHFSGSRKPWQESGAQLPGAERWRQLSARTPWAATALLPPPSRSPFTLGRNAAGRLVRAGRVLLHG
jgi:lipopolysaccharide biosynthesis glycosyltransferase